MRVPFLLRQGVVPAHLLDSDPQAFAHPRESARVFRGMCNMTLLTSLDDVRNNNGDA
jgi:hypothetical protein